MTNHAPIKNINGSDFCDLLRSHLEAINALRTANECMGKITPHARDYQTVANSEYITARANHKKRMESISNIINELESIAEFISDQMDGS